MNRFAECIEGEEYLEVTFSDVDDASSDVTLSRVEFEDCVFDGLRMERTTLADCSFVDCVFKECDFGVLLADDCTWRDVSFEGCRMQGADWRVPKGGGLGNQLRFRECFMRYGVFMQAHLPRVEFSACDLREAEFSDATLTGTSFAESELAGARFQGSNLENADFRGARGYDLDVTSGLVRGAKFSMPEAARLLNGLDIVVEQPPLR